MQKDKYYRKLIHTAQWVKLRHEKLTACPLCERCKAEGRITAASEVHHIKPVEDALSMREKQDLMFDYHNLRALCHDCHVLTHTEMGRSGKDYAKRVASTQREAFRKKFL